MDSVEQRVKGLDSEADYYMAKPFALSELEARVRALTRRGAGGGPTVIKHGPRPTTRSGAPPICMSTCSICRRARSGLLEVLLQRTGRLVSKEQLVDHLCEWGEEVSNNAIEVLYPSPCARRSRPTACASPPCAAWATAWRNLPKAPTPTPRPTATAIIRTSNHPIEEFDACR